jgi:hypothetical protein
MRGNIKRKMIIHLARKLVFYFFYELLAAAADDVEVINNLHIHTKFYIF